MSGISSVLIGTLILMTLRDCAAYCGPFLKHYFNGSECSLIMASTECRNTFNCYVYIPVHVWLVL